MYIIKEENNASENFDDKFMKIKFKLNDNFQRIM